MEGIEMNFSYIGTRETGIDNDRQRQEGKKKREYTIIVVTENATSTFATTNYCSELCAGCCGLRRPWIISA